MVLFTAFVWVCRKTGLWISILIAQPLLITFVFLMAAYQSYIGDYLSSAPPLSILGWLDGDGTNLTGMDMFWTDWALFWTLVVALIPAVIITWRSLVRAFGKDSQWTYSAFFKRRKAIKRERKLLKQRELQQELPAQVHNKKPLTSTSDTTPKSREALQKYWIKML